MIGNSNFEVKKETLKDSAYILTKDVSEYPSWGIREINERQKALAELAVQTWPLTAK